MEKINIKPEKFLKDKGIDLKSTALICYYDGYLRQPDLCLLMEEYAQAVLQSKKNTKKV